MPSSPVRCARMPRPIFKRLMPMRPQAKAQLEDDDTEDDWSEHADAEDDDQEDSDEEADDGEEEW